MSGVSAAVINLNCCTNSRNHTQKTIGSGSNSIDRESQFHSQWQYDTTESTWNDFCDSEHIAANRNSMQSWSSVRRNNVLHRPATKNPIQLADTVELKWSVVGAVPHVPVSTVSRAPVRLHSAFVVSFTRAIFQFKTRTAKPRSVLAPRISSVCLRAEFTTMTEWGRIGWTADGSGNSYGNIDRLNRYNSSVWVENRKWTRTSLEYEYRHIFMRVIYCPN